MASTWTRCGQRTGRDRDDAGPRALDWPPPGARLAGRRGSSQRRGRKLMPSLSSFQAFSDGPRLRVVPLPDARVSIDFDGATVTAPAAIDPTLENRRVVSGDDLQAVLDLAMDRGCGAVDLERMAVTPRTPHGGIVLRD